MDQNKQKAFDKLIVVGDRILIKPRITSNKTKTGLFLPPGFTEKEDIQSGYVVKVGPGYPIPNTSEDQSEPWKSDIQNDGLKYIPLQPKIGDLAIYLAKSAIEIVYDNEKYFVVSQHSILLLERDDTLFE